MKPLFAPAGKKILALFLILALACSVTPFAAADGARTLVLYWSNDSVDYAACDVWVWFPGKDGHGVLFEPCDYGVRCTVEVPEDVAEVGFIVRYGCSDPGGSSWGNASKDFPDDRYAVLTGGTTEIYLQHGDGMQYTSPDGGKTLNPIRIFKLAGIVSPREIRYSISPVLRIENMDTVHVRLDGKEVAMEKLSSLGNEVNNGVITLAEPLDLSRIYTVEIEGYGEVAAVPTGLFDSKEFIEAYTYEGDDLGAVVRGDHTVFKVWAPTASAVLLNLFNAGDGGEAYETIPMVPGEKGVWSAEAPCGHGTYYTYTVTTAAGVHEAVDPYARTTGVNGDRGMVTDLRKTDPEGFRESIYDSGLASYEDAVIWEVHVRDFSNRLAASAYPGKYLAFTEPGLVNASGQPAGVDYLKHLGVTHVHLQPVYDYATVDESSTEAQFNWGYDPKNYNTPEGSYATDPYNGEVRIREFKQMVQGLHDSGLGVVMDVVYNHTYSLDSCLNRIVPYYYYRFSGDGSPSNGSGCGNETASDRVMCRKYIVDSVRYWAEEYKLDGFRFDLMALHDTATMQAVEEAVHAVNPKALIYGEGWTGGTSPLHDNFKASQSNIKKVTATGDAIGSVAVFNDVIRDGLKGSVFDARDTGYANGTASKPNADKVIFGIRGGLKGSAAGWSVKDSMVINYTSSHDNNTLWDKLAVSCPYASEADRLGMNRLCAASVMISRGTPFFLAGEEMLRTKQGDSNSYKSSDEINNLDWDILQPGSEALKMAEYYRGLIALRKEYSFLRSGDAPECSVLGGNVIAVTWSRGGEAVAFALINPTIAETEAEAPAGWNGFRIVLQGDTVPPEPVAADGTTVTALPRSVTLAVRSE